MKQTWFGELRSLVCGAPSASRWRELCVLLERVDVSAEELAEHELAYCLCQLDRWGTFARPAPRRWEEALVAGQLRPWFSLATHWELGDQGLEDEQLIEWSRAGLLRSAQHLNLSKNKLGAQGLQRLLGERRKLPQLRELILWGNHLGVEGRVRFAGEVLRGLRVLELHWNALGDRGIASLASCAQLEQLRSLNLGRNLIRVEGARALGASEVLGQLRQLDLRANRLGDDGVAALLEGGALGRLRRLDLRQNRLSARGLEQLSRAHHWPRLGALILGDNPLGSAGVSSLLGAPFWPQLVQLHLASAQLDGAMLAQLSARAAPGLRELNLSQNTLGAGCGRALARASFLPQLEVLDLRRVSLGDEGLAHLLAGDLRSVRRLNLGYNGLGPRAATLLSLAELPALRSLELIGNQLGDAGHVALQRADWLGQLEYLGLKGNQIASIDS